jgi:hypothetical protein
MTSIMRCQCQNYCHIINKLTQQKLMQVVHTEFALHPDGTQQ